MAKQILVKMNQKEVGRLLKSDDIRYDLLKRAQAIQENAGDGYLAVSAVGYDRAYAIVRTDTFESRREEATNHTLLRSLHAGGGW